MTKISKVAKPLNKGINKGKFSVDRLSQATTKKIVKKTVSEKAAGVEISC